MLLTGFVQFPGNLHCSSETLGTEISVNIGGIDVRLVFPREKETRDENGVLLYGILNPLISPIGAEKWRINGGPLNWGHPYPNNTSIISRVVIFMECNDDDVHSTAKALYSDIGRWERAFLEYCYVISKQHPLVENSFDTVGSLFHLYGDKRIDLISPDCNRQVFHLEYQILSLDTIRKACEYASSNCTLFLEYQLLNEAYSAFQNEKKRQAIIDACSALEIVMVKQIKKYCDSVSMNDSILLSKYKSFGDRVKLVQKLYPSFFVDNLEHTTVHLRNEIAHCSNFCPSDNDTNTLICNVEKAMAFFHEGYY